MKSKKLLLLLLFALLAPWAANAQSLFTENFEGGAMPTGWTTDGPGTWSVGTGDYSTSTGAGQGTYNAKITHGTTGSVTKLITPEIDLSSVASAELSFMHVQRSWAGDIDNLKVYYRTSSSGSWTQLVAYTAAVASWTTEEGIVLPNLSSTYQLAFEHTDNYGYGVGVDNIVIVQGASCVKPTGLNVALTQGDGTVATLSWTSDATAWQICLNGDETNLIAATTNPWQLTGLTPETTYTAKVRANCGSEQSEWSSEVTFTPTNAYAITVNDGTNSNSYVPFYGYYADSDANSQFIIPASELADMAWGTINKLTFYSSTASAVWTNAVFDIYFSEVNYTEFETAALVDWTELSNKVYTGSVSIANNIMELTLTTPYHYMGGNLLIGFDETTNSSNYPSASWRGVTQTTNTAVYKYSTYSPVLAKFLPKITFDYTPGEAPACMWPTNFAVSNITARTADLSWTSDGNAWQIEYNGQTINVTQNSYTLTGLTPNTDYTVKVRTDCGADGYSDWTNPVSFTTDVLCHDPSNLIISDITAFSANASWTAETTSTLRYVAVNPDNLFFQGFVTDPGAMSNGADASWIKGESTLLGPGAQHNSGFMVAEDFTVNAATTLSEIEVYGYQTNSPTESTFTGLYAMILSGNPMEGPVDTIWGDMNTNLMTSTSFTNCYRGSNNSPTATTRPVMAITASGLNINLAAGTYYLVYNMTGTLSSGPWVVPQSDPVLGNIGDSWQYSSSGWKALEDEGSGPYGLAMKLTFGDIESFDWTTVNNISDGQYAMTNLNPATTYLVQVRVNCTEANSAWVSKTFTTLFSCLFPTDLVVDSIEARQAVLNWTENGDATEWEVEITGGNQTTTETTTVKPFTMVGLSPDTQYTVRVRSNCSDTESSEWSLPITFTTDVSCHTPTGLAISDITRNSAVASWVYEGDVELQYRPDMAWRYYDNGIYDGGIGTGSATDVYWAIMLPPTMLPTEPLTKVSVYETTGYNTAPITIMIYSGGDNAPGTLLYQEEVTTLAANDFHEITLAEAVTFDATQNLWIVCKENGTYPAMGCNYLGDPNGRWISLDGETWNDVYDYELESTWMLRAGFGSASTEWITVNNPASPQTITGLTPETNYSVRLRAVCGGEDGVSAWVTTNFTTDEACPAPTALAATPYANSAVVSWEGVSESYTVSYRLPEYYEGGLNETFGTSLPTGWTMYTGLLSNVMGGTALTPATYGWNFGTGNNVFDNHARCNIYGNYQRWLVTPAFELANGNFTFDMALTVWSSSSSASPTPGNQADDKFVVLISTDNMATWTSLRQWDNQGSEYIYDSITNNANGEPVSIDLSAYVGQTVNIAFYGESTTTNGDNNLHIDNVFIGNPVLVSPQWTTITVDEETATITGLTAETTYEWKVQGDCGDYGLSEESVIATFTTTNDLCPVPTGLAVDTATITATTADLSWNGSPDVESFTVRYRAPEHSDGGLYEPFNVSGVPTGWTRYSGLVDDVVAGTATLSTTTSGWLFSNTNVFGQYHAKVNIYGTTCKYWLVTPEVTPTSGTFSFDLALTKFNSSAAIANDTLQADDRFVVLVYADSTWTILREWNNSGSDYVYNTISATGQQVSIDLSAYVGQAIKIAFYGESTNPSGVANTGGDNDLHIDNVLIGTLIPATDWMTVENITDMNVTLTGLTPNTPYEAQVQNVCSDSTAWSNTVTFTTLVQTNATQTVDLIAGVNWFSTNLEINLDDLKAALVAALPGTSITIKAQDKKSTSFNGSTWRGQLRTMDVAKMYMISVTADCSITLVGMPINPAEHSITIVPGPNWIGFPLSQSMTPANAFAGFATNGDMIKAKNLQSATYNGTQWRGNLRNLEPGQGYIYNSKATGNNPLVFPSPSK